MFCHGSVWGRHGLKFRLSIEIMSIPMTRIAKHRYGVRYLGRPGSHAVFYSGVVG